MMPTKTKEAKTETAPETNRFADQKASLSDVLEAEDERVRELGRAVRAGDIVAETSNQRAPTADEQATQDKVDALRGKGVDVHNGFVRRGDLGASGSFAIGVTGELADAPAKEFQVTDEVLDSPTYKAMGPDNQQFIASLLMRHPGIVKTSVDAVPLEDPSFEAERTLTEGSQVPEGLGWVPAHYVNRARRIAMTL
jgi:hypothetical protein